MKLILLITILFSLTAKAQNMVDMTAVLKRGPWTRIDTVEVKIYVQKNDSVFSIIKGYAIRKKEESIDKYWRGRTIEYSETYSDEKFRAIELPILKIDEPFWFQLKPPIPL